MLSVHIISFLSVFCSSWCILCRCSPWPLLPSLSHKVFHCGFWNCAAMFNKYLAIPCQPFFSDVCSSSLLNPDCPLWTRFLQGQLGLHYSVHSLWSKSMFSVLLITQWPSDSITPSVLEKQNTMLWEILQNILSILFIGIYRIFHILSFLKMLVLLQFYMMASIASSTNYFFHSLISTHFHGHTLNLIIICILIRLPCSQKPSFTPDWLIPLLIPWFVFINFVSISSPLFPPFV